MYLPCTPRTIQFLIISLHASSVFPPVFVVFANFTKFQPAIVLIRPFYKITGLIPEININILWSATTEGAFETLLLIGSRNVQLQPRFYDLHKLMRLNFIWRDNLLMICWFKALWRAVNAKRSLRLGKRPKKKSRLRISSEATKNPERPNRCQDHILDDFIVSRKKPTHNYSISVVLGGIGSRSGGTGREVTKNNLRNAFQKLRSRRQWEKPISDWRKVRCLFRPFFVSIQSFASNKTAMIPYHL